MSSQAAISDLDLAALVSSRICHDIISPVGAIANGLELLGEENDQSLRDDALTLIHKSAAQASAKLTFARLAYGAAGSAGTEIDLAEAETVARAVVDGDKHRMEWTGPAATCPKDKVKLLLNLVTIGLSALPRGGTVSVTIAGGAANPSFQLVCTGGMAKLSDSVEQLLAGGGSLDAHSIQPYYTGRIAAAAGMTVKIAQGEGVVTLSATPA